MNDRFDDEAERVIQDCLRRNESWAVGVADALRAQHAADAETIRKLREALRSAGVVFMGLSVGMSVSFGKDDKLTRTIEKEMDSIMRILAETEDPAKPA